MKRKLVLSIILTALVFLFAAVGTAAASTIHVNKEASGSTHDGISWDTAFTTVQAGMDAAVAGDEIWVAKGTYAEHINLKYRVALYGGFAGTEITLDQRNIDTNVTILDGAGSGYVVTADPYTTNETRIDGFTIQNGSNAIRCNQSASPIIADNTITGNLDGAIFVQCSNPVISGNTITGNTGYRGAAILCNASNPTISDNDISNNGGSYGALEGGGIYCYWSSPTISGNTISNNKAVTHGGGIFCSSGSPVITDNTINGSNSADYGGGIYLEDVRSASVSGNKISGNAATWQGGGMFFERCTITISNNEVAGNSNDGVRCNNNNTATIINNTITGNMGCGLECGGSSVTVMNNTIKDNQGYRGSGIMCATIYNSSVIANNVIVNNGGAVEGGGVYLYYSSPLIANNTISGNSAAINGGGIYCYASSPHIVNNIVAFGSSGIFGEAGSSPALNNNDVFNNTSYNYGGVSVGVDDISVDPSFVDQGTDYHLLSGSQCKNMGDDSVIQQDWVDMDGQARIHMSHVDIGADEVPN